MVFNTLPPIYWLGSFTIGSNRIFSSTFSQVGNLVMKGLVKDGLGGREVTFPLPGMFKRSAVSVPA